MATDKKMIDYLRKVSPGNPIRIVIDDLVRSGLGGMIVFETPEIYSEKLFEGGFKINTKFSSQKLFELCKMDGAIVVSHDMKKILYANVLITPDNSITTNETGTRHKAAERCAKQADTFVIAISERRKKTTLYLDNSRYYLRSSDELLKDISANLQVLEDQRKSFNDAVSKLDLLEISDMVSSVDVCRVIQKVELMNRISEDINWQLVEAGSEGRIIKMRYRELIRNYEKVENDVLRDYSIFPLKKSKLLLENYTFDDLLDLDQISDLLFEKGVDDSLEAKGFRFLSKTELNDKEISDLVSHFGKLSHIIDQEERAFEIVLQERAGKIKDEIEHVREQILSGKDVSD